MPPDPPTCQCLLPPFVSTFCLPDITTYSRKWKEGRGRRDWDGWEREGVMGGQQEERRDGRGRGREERRGGEEGRGGHGVFFMLKTHELFSI